MSFPGELKHLENNDTIPIRESESLGNNLELIHCGRYLLPVLQVIEEKPPRRINIVEVESAIRPTHRCGLRKPHDQGAVESKHFLRLIKIGGKTKIWPPNEFVVALFPLECKVRLVLVPDPDNG